MIFSENRYTLFRIMLYRATPFGKSSSLVSEAL
jgi:hypothetical protein